MTPHDELKRLAEEATPGPWIVHHFAGDTSVGVEPGDGRKIRIAYVDHAHWHFPEDGSLTPQEKWDAGLAMQAANAALIAAANPAAVLSLLAELDRMREALEKADSAMTCRESDDTACYCPNCGRSKFNARHAVRSALSPVVG